MYVWITKRIFKEKSGISKTKLHILVQTPGQSKNTSLRKKCIFLLPPLSILHFVIFISNIPLPLCHPLKNEKLWHRQLLLTSHVDAMSLLDVFLLLLSLVLSEPHALFDIEEQKLSCAKNRHRILSE